MKLYRLEVQQHHLIHTVFEYGDNKLDALFSYLSKYENTKVDIKPVDNRTTVMLGYPNLREVKVNG